MTVEEVLARLGGQQAALGRAQGAAGSARAKATEVAATSAARGFAAVATGMASVISSITALQSGVAALETGVEQARAVVAGAPRQGSPEQMVGVLTGAVEQTRQSSDQVALAVQQVDQVSRQVSQVLHGGRPEALLGLLAAVRQGLVEAGQAGTAAREAMGAVITQARRLGQVG